MTREEAIKQIKEFMVIDDWSLVYMPQLHEALEVAVKDMTYCAEVDKHGSELNMMIAHHEQSVAEHKKFIEDCEKFDEDMKKWWGDNGK